MRGREHLSAESKEGHDSNQLAMAIEHEVHNATFKLPPTTEAGRDLFVTRDIHQGKLLGDRKIVMQACSVSYSE